MPVARLDIRDMLLDSKILHKVREYLRDAFLALGDTLYAAVPAPAPHVDGGVLLVRLDGIGDFFMWLSYAQAIREEYAEAHITLLSEASFGEYAGGLGLFDEVLPISRDRLVRDLPYRYSIFRLVRRRRYDIAILPCNNRVGRFRDGEALMRIARAGRKVGSIGEEVGSWRDRISSRWYTELLPTSNGDRHEFDRNGEFMRGLGIEAPPGGTVVDPPPYAAAHLRLDDPYFVLVPGAGSPLRKWPPEHFARLAERISRETGWEGVLCGGPSDAALAAEIQRLSAVEIKSCIGRFSLEESVQLIRDARLVVGNETGAVHIAACTRTPCVSITGGGHYNRFVPYPADVAGPVAASFEMPCFNCNWHCIYPHRAGEPAPCVAGVSIDTVWSKIEDVLRMADSRYDQKYVTYH